MKVQKKMSAKLSHEKATHKMLVKLTQGESLKRAKLDLLSFGAKTHTQNTPCKYPLLTSPGRTEKIPWWDVRSMIRGHLGDNFEIFYFRP